MPVDGRGDGVVVSSVHRPAGAPGRPALSLVRDQHMPAPKPEPRQPVVLGHVTGPMQHPVPSAPAPDAVWPSVRWWAHYSACPDRRKCRHPVDFPDWWLSMTTRGRLDPDVDVARERATAMVNGYKGHPALLPDLLEFVQKVVLDSLALAPAPISEPWMRGTLAAVSGLARWLHTTGQPLTREHAFAEETRFRYIATRTDQAKTTRNLNAVRLELIGDMLLGVTPGKVLPKATKTEEAPIEPLTLEDEADLWTWATGLRRTMRREAMTATLVLGLGCGLNRTEKYQVRAENIHVDEHGVHVEVTSNRTGQVRLVTCRADWEDRLAALKDYTAPRHYLMSPWRDTPTSRAADELLRRARNHTPVPVNFNNVRLRNTWLCHHLTAGTPLKVLMEAADMKEANHLHNLLALLPDTDPAHAAAALRGTRQDSQ